MPTPHIATLGALGLRLDVRASHQRLLAVAEAAFGRFQVPPARSSPLRLTLLGRDSGPVASAADPEAPGSAWHRERDALYVAGYGTSAVVAHLATGEIVAFLRLENGEPGPAAARAVLVESPVWRIAAWRGLTNVHAATVVVGGRTLVLRGPAGAGKSTLAAAAALAGHTVLAEEATWYANGDAPCLRGAPWTIHLDADGFRRLALTSRTDHADAPSLATGKRPVDVVDDLGGTVAEVVAPGPLVLLHRAPRAAAHWRPLPPSEARARFESVTTPGERTQDAGRWMTAREALLGMGAFELAVGDPRQAVAALEAIARRGQGG